MAVTTKTELWKLAATMMGMAPSQHILDANSPSTPLEYTFDTIYDQIRISQIRSGKFPFLRRSQPLRLAPTIDHTGARHQHSDVWDYVYAPPVGMLQFLGFTNEPPALISSSDYQMLPLPIAYKKVNATLAATLIIANVGSAERLPNYIWREWMRASFVDDDNVHFTIVDEPTSALVNTFDWVDDEYGNVLPGAGSESYIGGTDWSVDFEPGVIAGIYNLASAPSLILEVAYGNPYFDTPQVAWSGHIATNRPDAHGSFVVDVTDIERWPVEFQNSVAAELAYRASIVHAKSPRLIQMLAQGMVIANGHAIASLSGDEGHIEGGGFSRATRARY